MTGREIGVGVIGLGFMGRTHVRAYRRAAAHARPNRLAAVCDRDAARLAGRDAKLGNLEQDSDGPLFDARATATHATPDELLADPDVGAVSVCTPTDTHVELALRALEAGKHVLVEKPIALASGEVERLAAAARKSDRVCMPAMCLRFWPGWSWLAERVRDGAFGRVQSAVFRRLASRPDWAPEFYGDPARSGGALFDLHVHDADLVRWLFGAPSSVSSTGTVDHLSTAYRFADGPEHVVAEGGWDHADGFAFHMGYTVVFEEATADYALAREPRLLLARGGRSDPVDVADQTGYDLEVEHFLDACAGRVDGPAATVDEALDLTRMLEAERESLTSGRPVEL